MPSPFLCSSAFRQCSYKKTQKEKKIVNGFQPLTIFTKSQMFDWVLNTLLMCITKEPNNQRSNNSKKTLFSRNLMKDMHHNGAFSWQVKK